jgi:hypothetical protein
MIKRRNEWKKLNMILDLNDYEEEEKNSSLSIDIDGANINNHYFPQRCNRLFKKQNNNRIFIYTKHPYPVKVR